MKYFLYWMKIIYSVYENVLLNFFHRYAVAAGDKVQKHNWCDIAFTISGE